MFIGWAVVTVMFIITLIALIFEVHKTNRAIQKNRVMFRAMQYDWNWYISNDENRIINDIIEYKNHRAIVIMFCAITCVIIVVCFTKLIG